MRIRIHIHPQSRAVFVQSNETLKKKLVVLTGSFAYSSLHLLVVQREIIIYPERPVHAARLTSKQCLRRG